VATLMSVAARLRVLRPDVAPRVSKPVGLDPSEVTPEGDDPVDARAPLVVESTPVSPVGPVGRDGDESGPVGRDSSACR
jgi:hypothetical protein